jgi:hypothetical protein
MDKTTEVSVGRVICDARAQHCRCHKDAGHVEAGDPTHSCPPDRCTAQWRGRLDGDDFVPVVLPRAVGEPRKWEFT